MWLKKKWKQKQSHFPFRANFLSQNLCIHSSSFIALWPSFCYIPLPSKRGHICSAWLTSLHKVSTVLLPMKRALVSPILKEPNQQSLASLGLFEEPLWQSVSGVLPRPRDSAVLLPRVAGKGQISISMLMNLFWDVRRCVWWCSMFLLTVHWTQTLGTEAKRSSWPHENTRSKWLYADCDWGCFGFFFWSSDLTVAICIGFLFQRSKWGNTSLTTIHKWQLKLL